MATVVNAFKEMPPMHLPPIADTPQTVSLLESPLLTRVQEFAIAAWNGLFELGHKVASVVLPLLSEGVTWACQNQGEALTYGAVFLSGAVLATALYILLDTSEEQNPDAPIPTLTSTLPPEEA